MIRRAASGNALWKNAKASVWAGSAAACAQAERATQRQNPCIHASDGSDPPGTAVLSARVEGGRLLILPVSPWWVVEVQARRGVGGWVIEVKGIEGVRWPGL